ncbi:MAG: protein translocase subunit SecF [Hyphomonadaceae bacterium]|nr:protein translocase subunit SecF [Clostridia bacterium]
MKIIDFMKWKNLFLGVSVVIILIGLITFAVARLNYDIDFVGGSSIQLDINKEYTTEDGEKITKIIKEKMGIEPSSIQKAGATDVIIKTKPVDDAKVDDAVRTIIADYKLDQAKALKLKENIGASVGRELKGNAILAGILASFLILIYIAFRFEFLTGAVAVIALLHDVLIMIAVYAVFRISVNSAFVAAILTVLGYSINDTIIIFDRIRENKRNMRRESYNELVNKSITQTWARSINTVMTVVITLVVLYVMGVQSIKEFAFPLLVGVISGAYSSIFIAAPLWLTIHNAMKKKPARA